MSEDRFMIGARRRPGERPARRKVTAELAIDDEALVRLVGRDWGLSMGDTIGLMARSFVGAGWAEFEGVSLNANGAQRIRDALARWESTRDQPVLDPSIHPGAANGGEAGAEAGAARGEWAGPQAGRDRG
jgi:hypothetical protein